MVADHRRRPWNSPSSAPPEEPAGSRPDLAVAAGHEVTAVVRDPGKLTAVRKAVRVDLSGPAPELEAAVTSVDAVLSGPGPRTRADAGVVSRGPRVVVAALQAAGAQRPVVVSAADRPLRHPGPPVPAAPARPG
ncbi:hypothetical protein GCM10022223_67410 [Kineosporia mesophila]|uniref:NAD(P)-binding domain-containing protein n=1 Tax=Kineosporia mesophila TaxID=566012 RepID=A0ABP7AS11_9ACTN